MWVPGSMHQPSQPACAGVAGLKINSISSTFAASAKWAQEENSQIWVTGGLGWSASLFSLAARAPTLPSCALLLNCQTVLASVTPTARDVVFSCSPVVIAGSPPVRPCSHRMVSPNIRHQWFSTVGLRPKTQRLLKYGGAVTAKIEPGPPDGEQIYGKLEQWNEALIYPKYEENMRTRCCDVLIESGHLCL